MNLHERLEVATVLHADDLLCSGPAVNLEWVWAELPKKYELKGEVMREGNSGCQVSRPHHWQE